jgi:hypothetical protein
MPLVGVPRSGVMRVGEVDKTTDPVPVGATQVGVPAPRLFRKYPEVPAAVKLYAVPVPKAMAPAVGVAVDFVPPFAIVSGPEVKRIREMSIVCEKTGRERRR